ncbi:hypothetical protein [Bacteriovorax sp. Seq25_V]|uniref:hypothetical protein n=1 Tax=Bacteriovorax sp. Seq25_V TaxID=1201288 RepID=UPI00038A0B14|nr:hypothetical protein [Bacteriovorax sp. Seq25_V]EQC45304.1 hypothetical protein M900_2124 [Bacteriovorax sp. Seq25_V]
MKKEKKLTQDISIAVEDEHITDSFPLMVIICLFFVVTIMHLFITPNAMAFAHWFAK